MNPAADAAGSPKKLPRSLCRPNPLAPVQPAAYTCTFMADFQHKPTASEVVPPTEVARNAHYGLALFALYSALYSAFVLLNAFAKKSPVGNPIDDV